MTRPITLFTGQWADLPFEEVCRLASGWGYDGLELACWGDHSRCRRAAADDAYIAEQKEMLGVTGSRYGPSPITSRARPSATTPSTSATRGSCRRASGVTASPRACGSAPPRRSRTRAIAAAKLGVDTVIGFTGSKIWHTVAMFPPVPRR